VAHVIAMRLIPLKLQERQMQIEKELVRPPRTIKVVTKKRSTSTSRLKATSRTIVNEQPGIPGSGNRFVQDGFRVFGNR
jgi:hypothetical protein